ncbi:hypothetical protein ACFSCX_06560 [Bacillus salitolerans]|uniref:Uncharacterized protein n=1 Tax=Bacillus salitolerans TaxID=1437434 RepID=A0ABW4LQ45_9BACI
MKRVLFLGTKDKSDLVVYIGLILRELGFKTLIVDSSIRKKYFRTYTNMEHNPSLYDFFGVDIISATSEDELNQVLATYEQEPEKPYDVLLVDMYEVSESKGWHEFDERFYVGNQEKISLMEDAELLMKFVKHYPDQSQLNRIVFTLDNQIEKTYFDQLIHESVKWGAWDYEVEYNEFDQINRIQMQYAMRPTFKKLSRNYKKLLSRLITALIGFHERDSLKAMKRLNKEGK